ncbi:hypothetical protein AAVH_28922, partial [Aphelenchoides avenae]
SALFVHRSQVNSCSVLRFIQQPRLRLRHGIDGTVDNAEPTAIVEPTGNGVYMPADNY